MARLPRTVPARRDRLDVSTRPSAGDSIGARPRQVEPRVPCRGFVMLQWMRWLCVGVMVSGPGQFVHLTGAAIFMPGIVGEALCCLVNFVYGCNGCISPGLQFPNWAG